MTDQPSEGRHLDPHDLVQGDVELASPPEVYNRIREVVDAPGGTAAEAAAVIERDPALAARVLRLANSAFFGIPRQVCSITEAVARIGTRELQDLVLATEVIERFAGIPPQLLDIYAFWAQSLRSAVFARLLARQHRGPAAIEPVFLSGLLSGVGHLVLYWRVPELARTAFQEHRHRGLPLHEAEARVMGTHYAAVGAALAGHWRLPESLEVPIEFHPVPAGAPAYRVETALVHLARTMAAADSFDPDEMAAVLPDNPTVWKQAGLSPGLAEPFLAEAQEAYEAALQLLQ